MPTYVRKTIDFFISDKLRELLTLFSSESEVARKLLHRRISSDEIIEDHVNFVSISDSDPSKISYLTKDRISKIGDSPDFDYWTTSKRFHCKPGALVTKIFKDVSSKEVEKFSNLYKSFVLKNDLVFKIVSGDDIKKYYHQDSYQSESGSLGSSCMKYSKCQNFLDLYTKSDKVKMVILSKEKSDLIIGRALIWDCSQDSDGYRVSSKIMDRIYTIQDEDYTHFFKIWAKENGYWFKTNQNWGDAGHFDSKTEESVELKLSLKIDTSDLFKYPYLDTFKWLDIKSGDIFNYKPTYFTNDTSRFILLSSADGQYNDCNHIKFDDIDRVWRHPGDMEYYGGGNYTTPRNLNYSNIFETWILRSESVYEESIDDFIYIDVSKNDEKLIEERKIQLIAERKIYTDLISRKRSSNYFIEAIENSILTSTTDELIYR